MCPYSIKTASIRLQTGSFFRIREIRYRYFLPKKCPYCTTNHPVPKLTPVKELTFPVLSPTEMNCGNFAAAFRTSVGKKGNVYLSPIARLPIIRDPPVPSCV